ncbi:MAG: hypothetical protein EXR72_05895 [Myxococcales bacterium]|nr:hypothetical protein [Myxococcales bacterium]
MGGGADDEAEADRLEGAVEERPRDRPAGLAEHQAAHERADHGEDQRDRAVADVAVAAARAAADQGGQENPAEQRGDVADRAKDDPGDEELALRPDRVAHRHQTRASRSLFSDGGRALLLAHQRGEPLRFAGDLGPHRVVGDGRSGEEAAVPGERVGGVAEALVRAADLGGEGWIR